MVEWLSMSYGRFVALRVSGRLQQGDWIEAGPRLTSTIERERLVRLMVLAEDTGPPSLAAIWHDVSLARKHSPDIERIAFVGGWEAGARALATELITRSVVKVFPRGNSAEAWIWLHSEDPGVYLTAPSTAG